MQAILAAFWNNTCIVRLGIAPHFTNTLALDDNEESDGAAIMADVQSTRYTEDHLPPFASLGLLAAPNVLLAAGIVPFVWIECLSPTERLPNQLEVGHVFRVFVIEGEQSVIRAGAAMADPRHEQPVLGGYLQA